MTNAPEDGSVARDVVIRVLKAVLAAFPNISIGVDGANVSITKDGVPDVQVFPDYVTRRMLHRLQGKYAVNIDYFYHPERCCDGNSTEH